MLLGRVELIALTFSDAQKPSSSFGAFSADIFTFCCVTLHVAQLQAVSGHIFFECVGSIGEVIGVFFSE